MLAKTDGTWQPCGDYRRLNTATVDDRYPLPSLLDFSAKLSGCKFFSCIDLVKGYHQVSMAEADIPKTAIITPFGLFEYVYMPFGLKNAAQTFQRLMDRLFRRLPFVFTYLDDNLIASASLTEHWTHLRQFLLVMAENGLQLNPAKCVFAATSLKFLGHRVDTEGVTPLPKNVETIESFPAPSDVKGLQRFLGMVNFYRRFMPGLARIVRPLTDLLRGSPPPKSILWSQEAEAAFVAAKAALAACSVLVHPRPDAILSLSVDASDSHVGGVLQQIDNGSWRPLAFFSKKLSSAEEKYSTFDRELLAAYSAIRHFRYILEGRAFRLYTDHKPLVAAIARVTTPLSGRQQRHLSAISEFTTDVRYCPGPANVVADALSRPALTPPPFQAAPVQISTLKKSVDPQTTLKTGLEKTSINNPHPQVWPDLPPLREPCNANLAPLTLQRTRTLNPEWHVTGRVEQTTIKTGVERTTIKNQAVEKTTIKNNSHPPQVNALPRAVSPIDYVGMAAAQNTCPDVASMLENQSLNVVEQLCGETSLLGDVSTGCFRPLVPAAYRVAVMTHLHAGSHPGIRATVKLVSSRFCWPRLKADVRQFAQNCLDCQRSKVSVHVQLTPEHVDVPKRRFSHVHVDLVGPLPQSNGFTYLFTVVDRTTRWPEAYPLSAITAADCARALFDGWIQRFGVPAVITSDRGAQFTSSLWASLCSLLCITHLSTTAYHPQSNGMVERFHRRLKDGLRARLAGPDWVEQLPWILLGIRAASPSPDVQSPAEAVMGCQPTLPGEFLDVPEPPNAVFLDRIRQSALAIPRPVLHNRAEQPFALPKALLSSEMVLVRRDGVSTPLTARYDGPYRVLRRSLRVFELQVGNRVEKVSTLLLKPAYADPNADVALPPRRGRPPNANPPPVVPATLISLGGERTPDQKTKEVPCKKSRGSGIALARESLTKSPAAVPQSSSADRSRVTIPSGEPPPKQKTQVNPGKKAGPLCTNPSAPIPAKSGEKTTPTLGRGRHHVKNRPGVVDPPLPVQGRATPEIDRRSGRAKSVRFSTRVSIIPLVVFPAPPESKRQPDSFAAVTGRPNRTRKQPDRLGVG